MTQPADRAARAASERETTRVTWLGHSTVALEIRSLRLLTDPVFRPWLAHLRRVHPVPRGPTRDVDAVLVSHVHWDHLDVPSLRSLGPEPLLVVPLGAGRMLRRRGFARVTEVVPGDRVAIAGINVRATYAEHAARRRPWGSRPPSLGFVTEGSPRVYFAGDTDLFPAMAELAPVDVALLPIAGWGRRTGSGHLDAERAAEALQLLRPRIAIPIHWGTYSRRRASLSGEAHPRRPAEEFRLLARAASPGTEVVILAPGESVELEPAEQP